MIRSCLVYMKLLVLTVFLCTTLNLCFAQQPAYIAADGKVWSYGNVAFFGDMTNEGVLGSSPASILYFLGNQWVNGFTSVLSDESAGGQQGTGGLFRFAGRSGRQTVAGGYSVAAGTGASFPNLEVSNPNGILLSDLNDLKIRNKLHFSSGHIYLNGWNLMVGNTTPGEITGYSDRRFVVTGTGAAGGSLYRAKVGSSAERIVFPVGTTATNYAPAGVIYQGAADDFRVRVFDSVYQYAISGNVIRDSVVYKTWNVGRNLSGGQVDLALQQMDTEEATEYVVNRDSSYISRFTNSQWEYRPLTRDDAAPGTLTTQPLQQVSTMHTRSFQGVLGTNEYFTKLISSVASYLPADIIRFNAYRVSYSLVQLSWTTARESNTAVFEIERMLDNETEFRTVATVPTKALNGYSTIRLDYFDDDNNSHDGWSYYRIKVVSTTGKYMYTDVREVPPLIQVTVYPNPNFGQFKVAIRGIKTPLIMQLFDTWGQVIRKQEIVQAGEVQIRDMPKGTYFMVLTHKETMKQAYVCKIIVIDH